MGKKSEPEIVCFCFGYSKTDIVEDLHANGRSTIMEQIQAAKRESGCDCANKHPRGR